jgi:hypothetical protein
VVFICTSMFNVKKLATFSHKVYAFRTISTETASGSRLVLSLLCDRLLWGRNRIWCMTGYFFGPEVLIYATKTSLFRSVSGHRYCYWSCAVTSSFCWSLVRSRSMLLLFCYLDLGSICSFCVGTRLLSEARPSFVVSVLVPACKGRPGHRLWFLCWYPPAKWGQAITCILHAGTNIVFAFDMIYNEMFIPATTLDLTIIHNFCGPNSPLMHYIVHSVHYDEVNNSCSTNKCTVL